MPNDDLDKIERLHALRERGLLTEEEFAKEKERLLSGEEDAKRPAEDIEVVQTENSSSETASPHEDEAPSWDEIGEEKRRWPVFGLGGVTLVLAVATGSYFFLPSKDESALASPTPTSLIPSQATASPVEQRTLQRVSEANFNLQEEVPHCTLSNADGMPIFMSAILVGGERQAIIKEGGNLIPLSLAGTPNRFESSDGSTTALVFYDAGDVRSHGQDTVKFSGELRITLRTETISTPFKAECYATHFDEAWAGNSVPEPADELMDPFTPLSGMFRNGTFPEHYGTWALAEYGCGQGEASGLVVIKAKKIEATGEDGVLVEAATANDGVLYTTKFNIGDETWYRQYHIVDNGDDALWIDSEAFNDPYSDGGTRYSLGRRGYVRCGR